MVAFNVFKDKGTDLHSSHDSLAAEQLVPGFRTARLGAGLSSPLLPTLPSPAG